MRITKACPVCGKDTLVRFQWAETTLPDNLWYWRCALPGGCWAGPYVMEAVTPEAVDEGL